MLAYKPLTDQLDDAVAS